MQFSAQIRRTVYHELRVAVRNTDYGKIQSILLDHPLYQLYPFCSADKMEFCILHESVEYRIVVTPKLLRLGLGRVDPYRFEIEVVQEDASVFLHKQRCRQHNVPHKLKAALLRNRQVMLQCVTAWLLLPTTETIDLGA